MTDRSMDRQTIISGYDEAAARLYEKYNLISSAELLRPVADLLPAPPARIVDIGAGGGRDASWFAARGYNVVAVEPSPAWRRMGMRRPESDRIIWLDDMLPSLGTLVRCGMRFDCILLSGVWQHLDAAARAQALPVLHELLAGDAAIVVISFRHGPGAVSRACFDLPLADTLAAAKDAGLLRVRQCRAESQQAGNRAAGVSWTWLAFTRGR